MSDQLDYNSKPFPFIKVMTQYEDKSNTNNELNRAFDESVYSEYTRQFKYTINPVIQILDCKSRMIVGSVAEGTQMPSSDVDILHIDTDITVGNASESVPHTGKPYLCLTRGPLTPAGYTILQIYFNGKRCCETDRAELESRWLNHETYGKQNIFLTNRKILKFQPKDGENHGPSSTVPMQSMNLDMPFDMVFTYESQIIPNDMEFWFHRTRFGKWPCKTTRDLFRTMGCCYVGVGHSKSPEQDLEWRISPTRQELYLMLNLNPTQFRCYIILKIIKKHYIQYICGDVISSYHCKTALFYAIEESDPDIWHPNNLIQCVLKCLMLLLHWVRTNNCPNYFIPEENMFETKLVDHDQKEKLEDFLGSLTIYYLSILKALIPDIKEVEKDIDAIYYTCIVGLQLRMLSFSEATSLSEINQMAQCIKLIGTNTSDSVNALLNVVSPYEMDMDILLAMLQERLLNLTRFVQLVSNDVRIFDNLKYVNNYLQNTYTTTQQDSEYCLKLASFCTTKGHFEMCDVLLHNITNKMTDRVKTMCHCKSFCTTYFPNKGANIDIAKEETSKIVKGMKSSGECIDKKSIRKILKQFTLCFKFNESEYKAGIVLPPLHLDAFKTVGVQSTKLISFYSHIYDEVVSIHPAAYMYFLQYKNSGMLNKNSDMCVALKKFENINMMSLQEGIYCHPDTILNLLGHIYATRGWHRLAVRSFRRSWQMIPHYNAVKWHVMFMLFGI